MHDKAQCFDLMGLIRCMKTKTNHIKAKSLKEHSNIPTFISTFQLVITDAFTNNNEFYYVSYYYCLKRLTTNASGLKGVV